MDDDIIRILVATDNHLGVFEKDPIRSNDCFAAFEEVLATAKKSNVDFVLLAGDTFHENKPSRRTMHGAITLLRKYCLGDDPIYMEILNDQKEIFKAGDGLVNYENPHQAIGLPVFAVHGNHDDPSREGGPEPLAALDVLSACNLVNYIGKCEQVDDIEIVPVLIRKGPSMLALYSLGAIRDERLNRMWLQKKVKFVRPSAEQNRDYGRGTKNCLHESMIPEWMDLVIWGNEHECQPNLVESLVGTFRIFQPGSSIACSLVEGESMSSPKHMGLIEIKGRFFRLQPLKFTQIRPFIYSDIVLSTIPDLDPHDPKIEEKIKSVLAARVRHLILDAKEHCGAIIAGGEGRRFQVDRPDMVLVRLRVEHTGYPTINQQRFGTLFLDLLANPSTVLLFARKKKEGYTGSLDGGLGGASGALAALADCDPMDDDIGRVRIEDLVKESLEGNHRQLNVLVETDMAQAIDDFVVKKHLSAITDIVQETLERTQEELFKDIQVSGKDAISEQAARLRIKEEKARLQKLQSKKKYSSSDAAELSIFSKKGVDQDSDVDIPQSDDDASLNPSRGGGRGGAAGRGASGRVRGRGATTPGRGRGGVTAVASKTKTSSKNAKYSDSASVDDVDDAMEVDDVESLPVSSSKRDRSGRALVTGTKGTVTSSRKSTAKADTASSKEKAKSSTRSRPTRAAAAVKKKYLEDSDGASEENVMSEVESVESEEDYMDDGNASESYQDIAKATSRTGSGVRGGKKAPSGITSKSKASLSKMPEPKTNSKKKVSTKNQQAWDNNAVEDLTGDW